MLFPNGIIKTEMINNDNGVCIFKAEVGYMQAIYNDETKELKTQFFVLGTGHAYEKENSTFINKTSYIENCETSAVGRALGMAGFGIDTSVASAEEVQNAIAQQDSDKLITKAMADALNKAIENAGISNEAVNLILSQYDYKSTAEIKVKDYMKIVDDFKSKK